jgi:glycosyltransferase involved in cell wall biosynthesis
MADHNIPNAADPLVTVIAICHNHAPYVNETLESIRLQTYRNIQLIIINNYANDKCSELITSWVDKYNIECEYIENLAPHSLPENCNIGLRKARGKYYQILSCDDIILPHKLEKQVELFESLPDEYACIYGDSVYIDEGGIIISKESQFKRYNRILNLTQMPYGSLVSQLSERAFITAPTVLLRYSAVKSIKFYAEDLSFEDWPMWILLSKNGFKFYPIHDVVAYYRQLPDSFYHSPPLSFYESQIKMFESNSDYLKLTLPGARYHWLKSIKTIRRSGDKSWKKHFMNYLKISRDFSLRTFYSVYFKV